MARSRSAQTRAKTKESPADAGWVRLTWDDLDRWAGSRSVARGRTYQRGGRVGDLVISAEGTLLATVRGGERYATTVSLASGKSSTSTALESFCTCPVTVACKHAVAVVAEYLHRLAEGLLVPIADPDDPRWGKLDDARAGIHGDWYDDGGEEDGDDDGWDDARPNRRARGPESPARGAAPADRDAKIERLIRAMPQGELADLACALVQRFPELREEFRERIALQEGDVGRLVAETRAEIRRVTAEPAWRNHWDDEGHIPDYSRIRHRLERLLEFGRADEVVTLGKQLLREGLRQIGEAHDEGETIAAFQSCLPVVFRAVARSGLSGPDRLLFAIDAELADDYDVIGAAGGAILDDPGSPEDWSVVADTLAGRLAATAGGAGRDASASFARHYARDRLTTWIATALQQAGRGDELLALYEAEARVTGSYERVVRFLLEQGRFEDAERWARDGIAATAKDLPGIAAGLAESLRLVAEKRRRWDVVAAHAAAQFFADYPSVSRFDELMKAARKAKVEGAVRAAALRYLETGARPFEIIPATPRPAASRSKASARKQAGMPPKSPRLPDRVHVDASWPLPLPDYLVPLLQRRGRYHDATPRPHLDVLLQMAVAANSPDDVLRWYDKMIADSRRPGGHDGTLGYADRVAEAVSATHPERALAIYQAALEGQLPRAEFTAYANSAGYLRKLRPLYEALGRPDDWTALLGSIREKYRNRPRFMEQLDGLDGRTILQSSRRK